MTSRQLEYFLAVARYLNFTRAAEALYVSQTAITRQIQVLEEEVGAQLFFRTKKQVQLTAAGQVFLTEARAILERTRSACRKAEAAAGGFAGRLKAGYIKGYEKTSFSDLIMTFHRENPGVRLELERGGADGLAQALESGSADLIFAPEYEGFLAGEEYGRLPLREYPLRAVVYSSHPFAQKAELRLEDLEGDEVISQPPFRIHDCPDIENTFILVSAEMGVCVLPEYAARHLTTARNLTVIPVTGQPPVQILAYWKRSQSNPALARMLDCLRRFYRL